MRVSTCDSWSDFLVGVGEKGWLEKEGVEEVPMRGNNVSEDKEV